MKHVVSPAYLGGLSELAGRSFDSVKEEREALLQLVSGQLGMRSAFLTRITPEENRNEVVASHNAPDGCGISVGAVLPLSGTFWSVISGSVEPSALLIEDVQNDPNFSSHAAAELSPGIRSFIGVPVMLSDGTFYGTLCAVDPEPQTLTRQQADLLAVLARLVATQIERQRAQESLRESEAALNTILNNLEEGVLVADPSGCVSFANPAAKTMLVTIREKFLEELPDLWEDFHLPKAVAHCATSGESVEAQVRYGDTFLRVKLERLVGDLDEQGDVLVVIQDLSEGHRLEANQHRFLANAAHQLRTPTMAIMGAAELLATGEDANPATRGRLLNHIFSEGRRMQRLSDALLRLSRVGWDLREPSLQVVDLRAAGQQAAEVMEPLAESGGLRLSIEGEGASCVRADPEWLQEVLLVLLSNAIKHSSRGGDIRLRARAGTIIVEDEGAGVSSVDLPHIFERFYRGRGHSEGFGLGLSICRELTERMGGSISVRSREGVGTAVQVELPEVDVGSKDTDRRG